MINIHSYKFKICNDWKTYISQVRQESQAAHMFEACQQMRVWQVDISYDMIDLIYRFTYAERQRYVS